MRLKVLYKNHRLVVPVNDTTQSVKQLIFDLEQRFIDHVCSDFQKQHDPKKHVKIHQLMTGPMLHSEHHQHPNHNNNINGFLFNLNDKVEDVLRDGDIIKALDEQSYIDYQLDTFCDRKRSWLHLSRDLIHSKDSVFGEIGYHRKNKLYCVFGTPHHKQFHIFSLDELKNAPHGHEIGIERDFLDTWYVCAKFEKPSVQELKEDKKMVCEISLHIKTDANDEKIEIHQVSVHEKNGHLLKGITRSF
ncbi:hypothetical protein ABK040_007260 [Willaertia magna]